MPDVLIFPSHKEGFGVVAIEAAAMEVPTIGTNVVGLRDAIVDKKTGLLFEKYNYKDLAQKMILMSHNKELRLKYGVQGKERVYKKFCSLKIIKEFEIFYDKLLLTKKVSI